MLPNISGGWTTGGSNGNNFSGPWKNLGYTGFYYDTGSVEGIGMSFDASRCSSVYKDNWNEATPTNSTFKIWKRIN